MKKKVKIIGKNILCSLLVVVMVMFSVPFIGVADLDLGVKASAADKALSATGQCGDNVYWTFDSGTGEVVISGTGEMWDYSIYDSPFYDVGIKSVNIENGVTRIGNYTFYNCTALESVTISNSVLSIGMYAFYSCESLDKIALPTNLSTIGTYSFYNCTSLEEIIIPAKVKYISFGAFYKILIWNL